MEEIKDIIRKLTNNISATRFIVTADHGFIYTRSKNKESDKINRFFEEKIKLIEDLSFQKNLMIY